MIILNDINLNENTDLCLYMNQYRSDKGNGWHNYTKSLEFSRSYVINVTMKL